MLEFTPERNPIVPSVLSVRNHSQGRTVSPVTFVFTPGKSLSNALFVTKYFRAAQNVRGMFASTLVKDHSNVKSVDRHSYEDPILLIIFVLILEKNHTCVTCVKNHSHLHRALGLYISVIVLQASFHSKM